MSTFVGLPCPVDWGGTSDNPCPDHPKLVRSRHTHRCFVLIPIPIAVLSQVRQGNDENTQTQNGALRDLARQYHPRGPCRCSCRATPPRRKL